MANHVAKQCDGSTFPPGTVVNNRGWLWRIDAQEGVLIAADAISSGWRRPSP